ncbi:methyl-accepting chemotaxis protein [Persephonella sp.]
MRKNRPEPINKESEFRPDEIFFSTTDLKGIILSGNDVFVRVSKYSLDELIGSPHNIIRHPDMPRIVFKLLWDYIQSGKSIVAYVKNMAKDGSYYWVLATVIPVKDENGNIIEYLSIRIKPTTKYFEIVPQLYKELLEAEKEGGMEYSYKKLMEALNSLGYKNYDDFMKEILIEELKDKSSILKIEIAPISRRSSMQNLELFNDIILKLKDLDTYTEDLFRYISLFEKLREFFLEKSESIYKLTDEIRLIALNSSVESLRLGSKGAVFSVISAEMRKNSEEESKIINQMKTIIDDVSRDIKDIIFIVSMSKLEIIMFAKFLNSVVLGNKDNSVHDRLKKDIKNFFYLISSSYEYFQKLNKLIIESISLLEKLDKKLSKLKLLIEELEVMYFRGLIESGHMEGTNFSIIFTYVRQLVSTTKENIYFLEEPLKNTLENEFKIKHNVKRIIVSLEEIKKDLEKMFN